MPASVRLIPAREKIFAQGHPWVFSGALINPAGLPDGATVDLLSAGGEWLARGYFNSRSQIALRIWTRRQEETIDGTFFENRFRDALRVRHLAGLDLPDGNNRQATTAFRWINAEADGFPGLIVDVYGKVCVTQFQTLGVETRRAEILDALVRVAQPTAIIDRSDSESRAREGLSPSGGLIYGALPTPEIEFRENGLRFRVNLLEGQKTGYYLDQRGNRRRLADFARNWDGPEFSVLNAFSYTGAFGVYLAAAHPLARILHLDESAPALDMALRHHDLNGTADRAEILKANAFQQLRRFRDERRQFDLIVLDPPKFAAGQDHVDGACRGYKDLNLLALKLLRPGGLLATFSCTGVVSHDLFRKVIAGAACDARREVRILADTGHGPDHPLLPHFPEGEYLKGLFLRVT